MRCRLLTRIGQWSLAADVVLSASAAFAGNGCAPGTYSATTSPDGNATSFLFDQLFAASKKDDGPKRARCNLSTPIENGKGYSVFHVDYRGFAVKNDTQSLTLRSGKTGRLQPLYDAKGNVARDFHVSNQIGLTNTDKLNLSIRLAADGYDTDVDPAQIYLDSIDIKQIGFTTREAVSHSLDAVAGQRRSLLFDLYGAATQSLGFSQPFTGDNEISGFVGSNGTGGFNARWNATDRLTLSGAVASTKFSDASVDADSTLLLASSARYTVPLDTSWKVFGEISMWGAPDFNTQYSRSYMNGGDLISTVSRASAYAYGTQAGIGLVYAPDSVDEFLLMARLTRASLNVSRYDEAKTGGNLFAARLGGDHTNLDAADLVFKWTRQVTSTIDYSLAASGGQDFANRHALAANVDWVGKENGGWGSRMFGMIGARVGWTFADKWSLDASTQANFASDAKTDWNFALQLRTQL